MLGFLFSGTRKVELPISITVQPRRGQAIRNLETGELVSRDSLPVLKTTTLKINRDSLWFLVPGIRFGDSNLAGEGRVLEISVELPNGTVKLEAIGENYQRVGVRTSLANYLIEAKIVQIHPLDETAFSEYLKHGEKKEATRSDGLVFGSLDR